MPTEMFSYNFADVGNDSAYSIFLLCREHAGLQEICFGICPAVQRISYSQNTIRGE